MKFRLLIFVLLACGVCQAVEYERFARYDSLFSAAVSQANLPNDFRYLPLLLTECNPLFDNGFGAGLWGLSAPAAAHYGLKMTNDYDERLNPFLATEAAVAYLADLLELHDTEKALKLFSRCALHGNSTYQSDSLGRVLKTFFLLEQMEIDYRLNVAQNLTVSDGEKSNLTIEKNIRVSDFCQNVQIGEAAFRANNSALLPKAEILRKGYRVNLPKGIDNELLTQTEKLYLNALADSVVVEKLPVSETPAPMPKFIVYRVKSGDTLGHIAAKYHVGVSQLKRWNHLRGDMLQIGQKIKIYQ